MRALLKEQSIWAPLSNQLLKIDKLVLELSEEKVHFLILLSLFDESKERFCCCFWLSLANSRPLMLIVCVYMSKGLGIRQIV